jgi:hypothetical protein
MLKRLRRIEGQIKGIQRMVENEESGFCGGRLGYWADAPYG